MNAKLVLAGCMSTAIFIYNPVVASVGVGILTVAYLVLFKVVRNRLEQNCSTISKILSFRYRLMNEGFGGIRDVLILGRGQEYTDRFIKSGEAFADAQGHNTALTQVPRYFMELIAFGSIIFLLLYLFRFHEGDLGAILPVLSVYALAGFKLLPAFQQIYAAVAQVKGNISAFHSIKEELFQAIGQEKSQPKTKSQDKLDFKHAITHRNVNFKYPSKKHRALKKLKLTIKVNSINGFVGPSGSGKSTLIDLLLGLIEPDTGQVAVDGVKIDVSNRHAWQDKVGFVTQSVYLSEGSIAENIAFGLSKEETDDQAVMRSVELAGLTKLVGSLENGIDTSVGEQGFQLSGGQRRRIAIARALYRNLPVLVLDEATSALDGITEKIIMDAIHDFQGSKTIIMVAHRLKTVRNCDQIFVLDNGKIVDQGAFSELVIRNKTFRNMAQQA